MAGASPRAGTYFLGRYRVVDEIGQGGMASVHLARMDGPGGFQKWVAIKKIHAHLTEDEQFVHMFLDEARIAAQISHANVSQVFDLGETNGTHWLAMEYLHGEPLREVMRCVEEGAPRMDPSIAAKIIADAAEGLHAAHDLRDKNGNLLGLVHRDVTPHNLFVTYEGTTKVVDFGIAKVAGRLSSTRAGTLKGKLAYMSPEQVRGQEIDRRTDIFALGVVLWELTTGHRLFRMDSDLETLEKVQNCVVPPPSTIVDGYPPDLESVVMQALAKNKERRFQTARDFSRALQQHLMRRGVLIGNEEVAAYMQHLFHDRIRQRDAHLRWAAEVTQTLSIDDIQSARGSGSAEISMQSYESAPRGQAPVPRPAAGAAAQQPTTARPPAKATVPIPQAVPPPRATAPAVPP
ncbi:MAG: serine/threonine-protein kinase, partial [Polyangiaceae bacterium]